MLSIDRKSLLSVAVGLVLDSQKRLLVAKRSDTKEYAGKWEFPGGKCEIGETILFALTRELDEEIGVKVVTAEPIFCKKQLYSSQAIYLHFFLVTEFEGNPYGREGQIIKWADKEKLRNLDFLDGNRDVLDVLMESVYRKPI